VIIFDIDERSCVATRYSAKVDVLSLSCHISGFLHACFATSVAYRMWM